MRVFGTYKPELVIHSAAYTQVNAVENNTELCYAVNVDGSVNVSQTCLTCGAAMLSFSTDYVFDGMKKLPYKTNDLVQPLSVFGRSEAEGEQQIRNILDHHYHVHSSCIFGKYGKNFERTIGMLASTREELGVVYGQFVRDYIMDNKVC